MPMRNAMNPTRKVSIFDKTVENRHDRKLQHANTKDIAGICSACKTEVPLKPGFRPSSLKCPKCGKPLER
jgi:hypothetical protein